MVCLDERRSDEVLPQDIWVTWKSTYLQQLNTRQKWKTGKHEFRIGNLVFLKDDSFAYRHWPLARISAIYPGDDDITRAVDVTCKGKTWRRAVHHLIPFIQQEHKLDSSNSPQDNHLEECSDDSSSRPPPPSMFRTHNLNRDKKAPSKLPPACRRKASQHIINTYLRNTQAYSSIISYLT